MTDKKKLSKLLSSFQAKCISLPQRYLDSGKKRRGDGDGHVLENDTDDYDSDGSSTSSSKIFNRQGSSETYHGQIEDKVELLNQELFNNYFGSGKIGANKRDFETYFAECYDMQWLELQEKVKVSSLSWNPRTNLLACGCTNGTLKVVRIDLPRGSEGKDDPSKTSEFPIGYLVSPLNILAQETLASGREGKHNEGIKALAWNIPLNTLASGDASGMLKIWERIDGRWCLQRENRSSNSQEVGILNIKWTMDGERICIVYDNGRLKVSSKDGVPLWRTTSKEHEFIAGINWSPNSLDILVAFESGFIQLYDERGESKNMFEITELEDEDNSITTVCLYYGNNRGMTYRIAVISKNDKMYLYRRVNGKDPLCVKTGLKNNCADWSRNGLFLCIAGAPIEKTSCANDLIQLYNASGNYLFKLNIPYKGISVLAWDQSNLRLAIGVGSNIFFANIRPFYNACFFGDSNDGHILYSYTKSETATVLNFWNCKEGKRTEREITGRVIDLKGNKWIYAILTFDGEFHSITTSNRNDTNSEEVDLLVCGILFPFCLILLESSLIALSRNGVLFWKYQKTNCSFKGTSRTDLSLAKKTEAKAFHIDGNRGSASNTLKMVNTDDYTLKTGTMDPIICGEASEHILIVGRKSGKFHFYTLPNITMLCSIDVKGKFDIIPKRIFLNCDITKIGIIDNLGTLSICNLNSQINIGSPSIKYENVVDMLWAKDLSNQFCVKDNSQIFVVTNESEETSIASLAHLMSFENLELLNFDLDELMHDPENFEPLLITKHKTEAMKTIREVLNSSNKDKFELATKIARSINHPKLWDSIIKKAMCDLNMDVAETGFVHCQDYAGICLIRRLQKIMNDNVKLGEISIHYKEYEQAEKYFTKTERTDLITKLRADLGLWKDVDMNSLLRGLSSKEKADINHDIGNYFASDGNWSKAKFYYEQAGSRSMEHRFKAYLISEDYAGLMKLLPVLPENSPYFEKIGIYFAGIGICENAVEAYVTGEIYEEAVNCCVALNNWGLAMDISHKYRIHDTEKLLFQRAERLIKEDQFIYAIDLFKNARQPKYGMWLATMCAIKLIHSSEVFDAHIVGELFKLTIQLLTSESDPNFKMDSGLYTEFLPSDLIPTPEIKEWIEHKPKRGLVALNTLMKLQKNLYANNYEDGIKRATKLMDYTDILGKERVGSVVAIIAVNCGNMDLASKAFMLLESENPEKYSPKAAQVFWELEPIRSTSDSLDSQQQNNSLLQLLNSLTINY